MINFRCVCRSKGWNSEIERVDAHIDAGVEFLEEALVSIHIIYFDSIF